MNNNEVYSKLLKKFQYIYQDIEDCIYYMNEFDSNIENALQINDDCSYKNSIEVIKDELKDKKYKIRNEIIKEIESKNI